MALDVEGLWLVRPRHHTNIYCLVILVLIVLSNVTDCGFRHKLEQVGLRVKGIFLGHTGIKPSTLWFRIKHPGPSIFLPPDIINKGRSCTLIIY